ncbi:synergin gamma isoform X3 [Mastacembelus armatus]|uniref:Synergin, gamma n=1 Tax=Mastacembelus armatus TaxID=205130 RepID=A0A3Q3SN12_9TELE|nr:synergin gamma isoform X3 [Mastacembelus armatus]
MALRPGSGGGSSFMYPVGGGLGPPQGLVPMQQQQQQQQQGFPMVPVMQPNMQGMMGMNFGGQMPPGAMPMQGGMAIGMQTPGMQFLGQPQFMGMRPAGPQYTADLQKQMAEEHQKRLEQQQKMLEEERKRRQFEEQKQKLRLLSSVKPKTGEKSRDDALEAIKGNLDGFSRDAKMHPTPSSQTKKPESSPSHPSVTNHTLPQTLSEDNEFSDFQGPVDAPPPFPPSSSSSSTTSSTLALSSQAHVQPSTPAPKTGFSEDDEFSDFVQCPVNALPSSNFHFSSQAQVQPSFPSSVSFPQSLPASVSIPTATQHSAANTSSQSTFQGPSLEEKLFSSCDLTADKTAQVTFKSKQSLTELGPRAKVSVQFQSSTKARNWAVAPEDLSSVFTEGPVSVPSIPPSAADSSPQTSSDSGVGVYPQQEHIQPMLPAWVYNDSLVPEMFKKVLEYTMTPAGIDTAKLYPVLMSSGLPREALGQIWASANRTTPGMLTKEELYTVLALIGVAQSGLPALNVEILSQFPSPPVPNLPALAMAMAPVIPQHQQPMITQPPVSMPMPTSAPPVMAMTPAALTQPPTNTNFIASFPPAQGTKAEDDDFQDFQEAPKAGTGDQAFTDFQGETSGSFATSIAPQHQNSASALLTPVSGMSSTCVTSSDKYAVFKQLSADQPGEPTPASSDIGDKYSVFRQLEQPADKKPIGEGFADFKSVSSDDGFTDFKTADSVSPLDPSEQAKIFHPAFPSAFPNSQSLQLPQQQQQPAVSLSQPKNPLNMADLDLFSSTAPSVPGPAETKLSTFPSVSVPPSLVLLPGGAKPPGGGTDDFGDFALFGSSSDAAQASAAGGAAAAPQDDFADFMAFGSSGGEPKSESSVGVHGETSTQQRPQQSSDKYDVFKQLSLEGGLAYDDTKESGGGSFSSLKSDTDDFADFQSSKFCTALGASEKTLVDKVAAFKQAKEDTASVKSLDLPSIGGSSVGKDDSEDALSVQLDMKLSDMGGDLKHVMSDSSLDLPGLSAHQPPATEGDDMKFDPFGTSALSTLASYDWSEREECLPDEVRKPQVLEGASFSSLLPTQRKELTFGSTENITGSSVAKITTSLPTEDGSLADDKFEAFADFGSGGQGSVDGDDDFGDFTSPAESTQKSDSPAVNTEVGSEGTQSEASEEFGAFQLDKPKFGKSDFLKASAQAKVKSSEEMIKNELATFDLSVQGSHKRSHSLGEKEIGRSPPSPAPEQPFRDRSNTLSEKPSLPVIRDKYKDLTGEVEESERYAYEWQRCLESALEVITKANDTLNGISSSSVCTEVIQSAQGMEYLLGVVEVYRVARRVELGIKATAVCSEKLQQLLKDISRVWNNLMGFMSLAKLAPDESSLDFSSCILRHGIKNAKELACGVCLLNVDARSKALTKDNDRKLRAFNSETDNFKLLYGGHQYHASCANFWINCVEPKPPGLILPDLL